MKVYVDLDGVLADFEKGFYQKYKKKVSSLSYNELKNYKPYFASERFFGTLPMFHGAKRFVGQLIKMGHDVEILTAVSEFDSRENAKQKEQWVKKHISSSVKFNWVKKSHEKANYVKPNSVLIDDRRKSTQPFEMAGGKVILHTNFKRTLVQLSTMEECKMKSFKEYLLSEVAIQFGGKAYPKFGNAVILAGGAGSGKGFVLSNLLSIEGKVFDVDEMKKLAIASTVFASKVKEEIGVDVKQLNLRNPDNVTKIHTIIGDLYKIDKKIMSTVNRSVLAADPTRKPNLIFDVTLKDMGKVKTISTMLNELGYAKENIHVVWVMNKFEVAMQQNQDRARVVPSEIMLATHEGASLTFAKLLTMGSKLKKYLNGDIFIAFNQVKVDSNLEKSGRGGQYIKDANYIQVKKKGSAQIAMKNLNKDIINKIRSYVPDTVTW